MPVAHADPTQAVDRMPQPGRCAKGLYPVRACSDPLWRTFAMEWDTILVLVFVVIFIGAIIVVEIRR
jgi:hypothetical protein